MAPTIRDAETRVPATSSRSISYQSRLLSDTLVYCSFRNHESLSLIESKRASALACGGTDSDISTTIPSRDQIDTLSWTP